LFVTSSGTPTADAADVRSSPWPRSGSPSASPSFPAIYIGSALGAGVGGVALAIGGRAAPTITAAIIGVLAVTIAAAIVPE
jgi:predicted MFS family arabinose efflux permease